MPEFVDWFVNREKQYKGFQKMLGGDARKSVMMIEAPADMGKTWVIQRMRHHAEEQGVPVMHVDFRDRRSYDYLSLVRQARDQMGKSSFNKLTETINNFTGVNINIGGSGAGDVNIADIEQSSLKTGDIAAGDIIKDNKFYIQTDSEVARRAAEIKINDAFFDCVTELLDNGPVVFLFDSIEDITAEAERWLQDYLLFQVREKQMPDAVVIIAGRKSLQMGVELKALVAKTGLDLFTEDHVREYIEDRRNIDDLDIDTIFKTSGGFPGLLAKMADVAAMDIEDDDDWL